MFSTKSSLPKMAILSNLFISFFFISKFSFPYMSRHKNQSPVCVLMNFPFAFFLQLFFASYSTMLSLIGSTFCNNTIPTVFFESVLGSIAQGLSTVRDCKVGTMSEGNITSTDINEFCNSFTL